MESMVFVLPTALLTSSNQTFFILFFSLKCSSPRKKKKKKRNCLLKLALLCKFICRKFCLASGKDSCRSFRLQCDQLSQVPCPCVPPSLSFSTRWKGKWMENRSIRGKCQQKRYCPTLPRVGGYIRVCVLLRTLHILH